MGNIEDEYDEEKDMIIPRSNGAYESAVKRSEDVLELFGYELEEDHEYDTIAGLLPTCSDIFPKKRANTRRFAIRI